MFASEALVCDIQKLSTEDGPGIRTTVFFKECPLRCAWCHNPESLSKERAVQWVNHKCIGCETCIDACPCAAISFNETRLVIDRDACISCGTCAGACPATALTTTGWRVPVDTLVADVAKDLSFFKTSGGGVTASGGEPTLQPAILEAFLKRCKERGISTALDTCGTASRKTYERLFPHVDLFLYDIKEIDPEKHERFTGVTNNGILATCKWLASELSALGKPLWIRTPLVPGFTATVENVRGIGTFIVNDLGNAIERWDLLAFNNLAGDKYARLGMEWPVNGIPLLTRREMAALHRVAVDTGANNPCWSGMTRNDDEDE